MSAAIKNALKGLSDSVEFLDLAAEEASTKSKGGQHDLFGSLKAGKPSPSNTNAANVEQMNSKAFASRLDSAIGRVEQMLKEGRA